jgi:hypothetical protein
VAAVAVDGVLLAVELLLTVLAVAVVVKLLTYLVIQLLGLAVIQQEFMEQCHDNLLHI